MKLLLDEPVRRHLAASFPAPFTTRTVQEMGWSGTVNGLLLSPATRHGLGSLVNVDRGIEYRQSQSNLPLPVVIMIAVRNRLAELQPLVHQVVDVLMGDLQARVYRVPG